MWFSANFVLIYVFLNSDPDKHYLMYEHERVPIAVCEKEPSSIIAFALRYYRAFSPVFVFSYFMWIYLLIAVLLSSVT